MTLSKDILPYGAWDSPVTTNLVAGKTLRFGGVQTDGDYVYWTESRPFESGRCVIMRGGSDGSKEEILQLPFSARSRIHEYGGGEFTVSNGEVFFVGADDQDVYRVIPGKKPVRITDEVEIRFADFAVDREQDRLIAVTEVHSNGSHHPENMLMTVGLDGAVAVLHEGYDFYAFPRISPDRTQLAWVAWDLPDMPWDSAGLYLADFNEDGGLEEPRLIAGGYESAVFQPEWGPDGRLYYVCDESGFGNLYAFDNDSVESVCLSRSEFGRPLWSLGTRSYAFDQQGNILAATLNEGNLDVVRVDVESGKSFPVKSALRSLDNVVFYNGQLAGVGSTDFDPPCIVSLEVANGKMNILQESAALDLEHDDVSVGCVHRMPCKDEEEIFGIFYPPANARFAGPEGDKPPLIVMAHGGPTGYADRGFKMKVQYWTSRGFAVFDLDYSGSYGYGRDYMQRLDGQWGVRDVQDVACSVDYLVKQDMVNPEGLFITGGSAGGFTVLLALAELDVFAGGACSYGVADLVHLQDCTHKFEGGYLFRLMGVEAPEDWAHYDKTVFVERSPTTKAHMISRPVIFFQGLEDKVVPPEQTRAMVRTLEERGQPVVSMEFEGEGHGFRQTDTVKTVLDSEYRFYLNLLGLNSDVL